MKLADPTTHKDWLPPHSFAWYAQLEALTGEYAYPWHSTTAGRDGEQIFDKEVAELVPGQRVLDIGCGDGAYTISWSPSVKSIVGLDVTPGFIETGNAHKLANVSFVAASTKAALPFANGEFDCAYNRKGPTSAYPDLSRVVRQGGLILGLHPGDHRLGELAGLIPTLFKAVIPAERPVLDKLESQLAGGNFAQSSVDLVTHLEYLHQPLDVIRLSCFGQTSAVHEMMISEVLPAVEQHFREHATPSGLAVSNEYYIVRITV
ncbi:class I SAM-dependent methyltransferase [Paenibacillus donghaensis]|uniref:SAM-dependent methyltransferase n=1 Tax=Paenibacillus donghaensis TaxID=414771 RepID=A0A2Z2KEC6_9BACL|nr:class I SAM-dependent methyltransferase [Paenibacillus donghaensis]ASA21433.1 SAM-dependent methyltransferase [Paenibacillus donghaensis]